ncbi:thioesterase domain-containing protein [Streptomyces sp. NPDC028635]|uniref:thioesterase II family protein n=1 Tax=Streptomyces sp. NPDC028635 TaxID=3154800 RepID=UPI003409E053
MNGMSVRLFCLPCTGAPAGVHLPWADRLQPHIAVTPLELPGRGARMREKPCRGLEPLLQDLVGAAARLCDRPFALFGHGFGALLAFEVAARLEWDHELVAERLYVSGAAAPHLARYDEPAEHLADDAFLARARRRPHIHPGAFADARLARLRLPLLRADLALARSYRAGLDNTVHAPVTALAGRDDPTVSAAQLGAWRGYTRRSFRLRRVSGGHYHWLPDDQALLETFVEDLTRAQAAHNRFPAAERTF